MQRRRRAKQKNRKVFIITMVILAILAVALLYGIGYIWSTLGDSYEEAERGPDYVAETKDVIKEPINILLLGVDSNKADVGRSDTIMVARLNPDTDIINIVSLPRDTYAEIGDKGYSDKVNHSLNYGVGTTIETVENFFDIKIDYYIAIDFQAFTDAIDALGGIEINVDKRMKYTDVAGNLYIDLQPGLQTLNGEQALGYARFRSDSQGDLGRIDRQQEVIRAVLDKSTDIRSLTKIFDVIDVIGEHMKTDIPRSEMAKIFTTYRDFSSEDLISTKVEGESKRFGEQNLWYYMVDGAERERLHLLLTE